MHNKDYDKLSATDREKLLHSIGKSYSHTPKGYEIDQMMRNYKPNASQQQQPQRYGTSSLSRDSDTQYKGGAGPGDIPD